MSTASCRSAESPLFPQFWRRDVYITVDDASTASEQVRRISVKQRPEITHKVRGRGSILLGRNPRRMVVEPAPIPDAIQMGLNSQVPEIRVGALHALRPWLTSADTAQVAAARRIFQQADTDIPRVAAVARHLQTTDSDSPTADLESSAIAVEEARLIVERARVQVAEEEARAERVRAQTSEAESRAEQAARQALATEQATAERHREAEQALQALNNELQQRRQDLVGAQTLVEVAKQQADAAANGRASRWPRKGPRAATGPRPNLRGRVSRRAGRTSGAGNRTGHRRAPSGGRAGTAGPEQRTSATAPGSGRGAQTLVEVAKQQADAAAERIRYAERLEQAATEKMNEAETRFRQAQREAVDVMVKAKELADRTLAEAGMTTRRLSGASSLRGVPSRLRPETG